MRYTVTFAKEAMQALDRMDRKTEKRIQDRIDELAIDPFSFRLSKRLVTTSEERTSRVGSWRIVYLVHDLDRKIEVLAVRPRQKAYKKL